LKRKSIVFDLLNPEPPAYVKPVSPSHSKKKSLLKEPSMSEADLEMKK
jgi:hypothetical protein